MRGIPLTINFKVKAEEFMSHTVTVCEICYVVAIAEYHLMLVEREFAIAQSIPIKLQKVAVETSKSKESSAATAIQPVLSSHLLTQWRVLFYFDNLLESKNIIIILIDGQFTSFDKDYYIQFRYYNYITKLKMSLKTEPTRYPEGNKYFLNKMRVHYFFSTSKDVDQMLKTTQVEIRITEGESWEKAIFAGKSQSLAEFISEYCPFKTILLPKCVYLFSPDGRKILILQVLFFY